VGLLDRSEDRAARGCDVAPVRGDGTLVMVAQRGAGHRPLHPAIPSPAGHVRWWWIPAAGCPGLALPHWPHRRRRSPAKRPRPDAFGVSRVRKPRLSAAVASHPPLTGTRTSAEPDTAAVVRRGCGPAQVLPLSGKPVSAARRCHSPLSSAGTRDLGGRPSAQARLAAAADTSHRVVSAAASPGGQSG
jgi:hypothetical protein